MTMKPTRRKLRAGSQLEFIAQHLDLDAAALAELGAKHGHELTPHRIHVARSTLKSRGITEPLPAPLERPTRAPRPSSGLPRASSAGWDASATTSDEDEKAAQLARLALALGYDRAVRVLEAVRLRIEELRL